MSVLISFFELLLYCAVVIFVAYCIAWAVKWWIGAIDPNVYKFGQIIVGLLCIIALVVWLAGLLGAGGGLPHFYSFRY